MLAAALGLALPDADKALQFDVAVSYPPENAIADEVAHELKAILGRTVRSIELNGAISDSVIEVVIGNGERRGNVDALYIAIDSERAIIGPDRGASTTFEMAPIFAVIIACYASAAVMHRIFGHRLPFQVPAPLTLPFAEFGVSARALQTSIDLGTAYLVGAGAVGNGFLWAARDLDLRGELNIVDDDIVSSGNLNRQIWFSPDDIDKPKAERLTLHAQRHFRHLKLIPRRQRLQDLTEKSAGPWLKRMIVAVDSRRARRSLQNEFPGEVFDASTTDIREVVVHHHRQITENACLSCIYEPDGEETSREAHIAEHLGVSIGEVREERISEASAILIGRKFPQLDQAGLAGVAYDTLFKQLCGAEELKTLEGRRVVAPFAFVSVLAGSLLALEVVRRLGEQSGTPPDNYWRVSPWHPPLSRRRICRPKQSDCEFCGNRLFRAVNTRLWGR